jgi:poly(3-hydroxybutyrate) depolymerase
MLPRSSLAAAALGLSLTAAASTAPARCLVRPTADGAFATWLVTAPYALGALQPRPSWSAVFGAILDAPPRRLGRPDADLTPSATATSPAWRPATSNREWLDVGAAAGGRGARVVYAGVVLDVRTAGPRYLALGGDDALSVRLDGREVLRRAATRASASEQDFVRLDLAVGRHPLVVKLASRGDLDLFARVVTPGFARDPDVRIELPDVDDAQCLALTRRAAAVSFERRVAREGTRVEVAVNFPGGAAVVDDATGRDLRVTLRRAAAETVVPLRVEVPERFTYHDVFPGEVRGEVVVDVDGNARTFPVDVPPSVRAALVRAWEVLPPLDPAFGGEVPLVMPPPPRATEALPAGSIWSVERAAERLAGLVRDADPDTRHLLAEAALLDELLTAVAAGRDPYAGRRGAIRRAYRSPLDGALQEYSVYVPPSYRGDADFPVVMGLHGLRGSNHRMLPILLGFYDKDEDRTRADRHLPPLPDTQAILVAPWGFGDAMYRQQGEHDVMRALEEVRRAYRVDVNRTYMTGLSMGGIGAAGIPFHHPGVFAAIAALCGYHSYFVRQDTRGVRRPWETFLMELRSNAHYAENGLDTPLYVVQGTLDRPITNSTVLTERYTALGYTLRSELPVLDHDVWSTTYADGRIVRHFLQYRRDPHPRRIRFRTPDLRWNTSSWLTLDAMTGPEGRATTQRTGHWAEVTLDTARNATGTATTTGVAAFTLTPPRAAYGATARALTLTVDGTRIELPLGVATTLVRRDGRWSAGERPTVRAGGPIREVFDTPVVVVYGAGDPVEARVNERVARQWAERWGVRARYAIVRDDSYTEAMGEGRTLVLVGRTNRLLARRAAALPVRVDERAVTLGDRRFEGPDVGAVFTAPDPELPSRTLLVVAGTTPVATLHSRSLPDLIPEYVVYDPRVAPARGRVTLGSEASVLAAGFFDSEGRPVGDDRDPMVEGSTRGSRP